MQCITDGTAKNPFDGTENITLKSFSIEQLTIVYYSADQYAGLYN